MFDNVKYILKEDKYEMAKEALNASLFTTGNGYMGIRGSFEEYSTLGVQGGYIRGFFDELIEVAVPIANNSYMKKYYINDEALKDFKKMDFGLNFADILTVRIEIDGKEFRMEEGEIKSYERALDLSSAVLRRSVCWDNGKGDTTEIVFERFASFSNDNLYCQKITLKPLNHSKTIKITSGHDLRTKTNGQYVSEKIIGNILGKDIYSEILSGNKYKFKCGILTKTIVYADGKKQKILPFNRKDIEAVCCETIGNEITIEKISCVAISRDTKQVIKEYLYNINSQEENSYLIQLEKHLNVYKPLFENSIVEIDGDDKMSLSVAFSCYHTLTSASRNDGIHGVSAKGLTGEHYHQYVWWDSEIYQMPFFLFTNPETAKHTLEYRYSTLKQAEKNAKEQGCKGARFAFCSSVNGDECVWKFCRHPFMQDHISADVGYAVLHYYFITLDKKFMQDKGFELLFKCIEYWLSRVTRTKRGYEILKCTGTDEHHPYIDNDAYTNYLVNFICIKAVEEYYSFKDFDFLKIGVNESFIEKIDELAKNIYLPLTETGYIPQFDNYFNLKRGIDISGGNAGNQMKYSGEYHKSQIIKQPDVLLLYTYLNIGMDLNNYAKNFDYYETMCENSSSLSYAPHAIAAADNGRILSFYNYLEKTSQIDLLNLHGGSEQGVHSGCLAGAWYSIFRGLFGCICLKNKLILNPKTIPWLRSISLSFIYHGVLLNLQICDKIFKIMNKGNNKIDLIINGIEYQVKEKAEIKTNI
jgi:trehalose/maltose hydrolase-like predicted phosphorylase